jgi:hypothetical protein
VWHYAGQVIYNTDMMLDKNRDYLVAEHQVSFPAPYCSPMARWPLYVIDMKLSRKTANPLSEVRTISALLHRS